ncbi:MAG: sulfatase-like hydrolase/transferase, partial [Gammaproteobacteria bacterium]|nr:sulfatase-like hydrolase/transferase [Gammaproteobacteria bacterium]
MTFLLVPAVALPVAPTLAQPATPNVVIIFADDLGYGDLGSFGANDIFTPNIDQLASEGVRFTRFYAAPSCTPSRAMLMTGSYFPRLSTSRNFTPSAAMGIHEDELTLGEIFKDAGYATGTFGKWHLGDHYQFLPGRHGFDEFYGIPYSNNMWPFHPRTAASAGEDPRLTAARSRAEQTGYAGSGSSFPVGEGYPNLPLYDDDTIVEFNSDQTDFGLDFFNEAIDFIERHQSGPFFVYIPVSAPHVPLHPSAAFVATSGRDLYGDTVQEMDAGVGLVLSKLTELGIDNQTLVIFLSDNGPWLEYGIDGGSAGPLRGGKEGQFEGGIRVPALMRWPGQLTAGRVISEPVQVADILPTLAGLAGAVPPASGIDGSDIWDLLTGVVSSLTRQSIFSFKEQDFSDIDLGAVISRTWKLHVNTNGSTVNATALFNLANDPGETTDVKSSNPGVVSSLVAQGEGIIADIAASQRPPGVVARNGEPFSEKSGVGDLIAIEAENYHLREARGGQNWQSVSLRHSSFEASLQALPNSGTTRSTNYETSSPHLVYRFVAEQPARYYVWIRARGASNSDDSLHVGLDGIPVESGRALTNIASTWSWTSTRDNAERAYVDITAMNEYELDIWMREDGVVIDKILLTTDATFRPYGKGPVESLQTYAGLALPPVAVDDGPYAVPEGGSISGNPNVLSNDIDLRGDP